MPGWHTSIGRTPLRDPLDGAFAAVYDRVLAGVERAGLADERTRLLATARGRVLEVGAGTGANLAHLPRGLERLVVADPSPGMRRRLAARIGRAPAGHDAPAAGAVTETGPAIGPAIEVVDAPAEELPFPDASFDTVVATLVLCSVRDPDRAAAELCRVLAADGRLLVIEHVRGHGATARLQRVLDPAWRLVARGCRLVRDTRTVLERAGFDTTDVRDTALPGGGPTGPAIVGTARPRAARTAA